MAPAIRPPPQEEQNMTINQRFVFDENRDVIDKLNPNSNPASYFFGDAPEEEILLRESVLRERLHNLVGDLITNLQPKQEDPLNKGRDAIYWAIGAAIRASHLNTFDPAESIKNRFDGKLKRLKNGLQEFTSLSHFRDDVERLLRDIFGDIECKALDQILAAVFKIVYEFTFFVRKDLWQEHHDAEDWDYIWGIGVPDGCGINGHEWRRGMIAISDLAVRAREVRDNPSAFSKYTIEFANTPHVADGPLEVS
jgi:hypothetical protein